ncbi:MAG: GNAT family N-acetyltransferase [Solirubrobacterales bacterium]|nr:GNAT family N-acetyltransferase [Solirubrobacterales bacterium]
MIVRRARVADVGAAALVAAAVAEEDFLGLQPPVDLEERAERFRDLIAREAMWVLEARGQVVGYAAAPETTPGVLSVGMAIEATARGQGGGRALLAAVQNHARSTGAQNLARGVDRQRPGNRALRRVRI